MIREYVVKQKLARFKAWTGVIDIFGGGRIQLFDDHAIMGVRCHVEGHQRLCLVVGGGRSLANLLFAHV